MEEIVKIMTHLMKVDHPNGLVWDLGVFPIHSTNCPPNSRLIDSTSPELMNPCSTRTSIQMKDRAILPPAQVLFVHLTGQVRLVHLIEQYCCLDA